MAPNSPHQVYQFKVTLRGIRPPIWRRIQVPASTTLAGLHRILQAVMGWEGYHLHQFELDGTYFGVQHPEDLHDVADEAKVTIADLMLRARSRLRYEYDFGDGWEHELVVEKILEADPEVSYPVCLTGKRACPPEDCGGPWGYENLLRVLKRVADPRRRAEEEDRELAAWAGRFSPEEFSELQVEKLLGRLRPRPTKAQKASQKKASQKKASQKKASQKKPQKTWLLPTGRTIRLIKG